jgi:threonine dehydratase
MRWFAEGGWSMWVLLLLALPAVAAGFAHLAERRRVTLYLGGGAVLLAVLVGVTGWMSGQEAVESALAGGAIDPAMVAQLRAQGEKEARRPLELAGAIALVAGLLVVGGELKRR